MYDKKESLHLIVCPLRMVQYGNGFDSCDPVRSIPVIAITGTNDILVPYEGTGTLASFAQDQTNARVRPGRGAPVAGLT